MRTGHSFASCGTAQVALEKPTRLRPDLLHAGGNLRVSDAAPMENTSVNTVDVNRITRLHPTRLRTLLVPLDGSAFGERALPLAVEIARSAGAELRIVHVDSTIVYQNACEKVAWDTVFRDYCSELRRHKRAYVERIAERIAKESRVRVTPIVLDSRHVPGALCEAVSAEVNLVVMAAHGDSPIRRWKSGGTLHKLIRGLPVPLLVVGADGTLATHIPDRMQRILIALDGSRTAEQALGTATTLGGTVAAEYVLLRVVRLSEVFGAKSNAFHSGEFQGAPERAHMAAAGRYLQRVARRMERCSCIVNTRVVLEHKPIARSIAIHAQKYGADLIAIATRKGVRQQGSIADRVVQFATVPVLISAA